MRLIIRRRTRLACDALALAILLRRAPDLAAQGAQDSVPRREPWSQATDADSARLFYKGLGFGSDAYNTPLTVLLNKGYDVFQLRSSPRNIWSFPYGTAWQHGIADVARGPGGIIRDFGGWGRFARFEMYPSSLNTNEWNWLVNYTEHFIGGGVTMRMLHEWYREHGVPLPRVMAILTTFTASMLNEITEQQKYAIPMAGTVADLLIFDVAAVSLFHWKQPATFLARTLQLADWSSQAAFTYPNQQLQNNGQYLTLKVPVGLGRTRLFIRGGMGIQFGVSRKLDDSHHLSVGLGGDTQARSVDDSGLESVGFAAGTGIYFDRNNSLLWSVTSSPAENVLAVNVYPGTLGVPMRNLGLWGVVTRHHELRLGVVHRKVLGLGAGYGR
ncbi:MAG: hypothetical protein AABZ80_02560 [Gemmatimonadota bacterium]